MINLETRRKRIELLVKLALLPVIGFIVAPFIFTAIQGLIGVLVAAIVGVFAVNFAPVVASKIANWRLKAIKHEASQNPIETLQNEYMARQEALNRSEQSISKSVAHVESFKAKLVTFKKAYPDEADKFDEQYAKMRSLVDRNKEKHRIASQNLVRFDTEIKKATAIWEMAKATAEMNAAVGLNSDDVFSKIQTETALESVQQSMHMAFADLEVGLLEQEPVKQLSEPSNVVTIPESIKTKAHA